MTPCASVDLLGIREEIFDLSPFANRMACGASMSVSEDAVGRVFLKGKTPMSDKRKEGVLLGASVGAAGEPPDDEIARYREILAREPASVVFAPLSDAYRKRGMLSQAIEVCIQGLLHHPNLLSGRVALARALYDAGEIHKARQEAETVVKSAPENLAALRLLASICRDQGDSAGLLKTLGAIVSLDPSDREALAGLSALEQDGESSPGDRAGGSDGKMREIVTRTLAEIYAAQGYYDKAIEMYRKLRILDPADSSLGRRIEELRQRATIRSSRGRVRNEGRN